MAKQLKAGIIGCGGIAEGKHIPALAKIKEVELAALSDRNLAKCQAFRDKFAIDAKVYVDYRELLNDESIDVVHICTPNYMHEEMAVAALLAGKHVNCEKPMALNGAGARRMLEAAKQSGKKLTISYQNRFQPEVLYLKQLVEQGDLGHIYFAKAHALRRRGVPQHGLFLDKEKQGGGPLIDIGTHALDLTLWAMDNYEPASVMGKAHYELGKLENAANPTGPWDPRKFTVEDSAFGMITMKNGATVILESSWALNIRHEGTRKTTLCGTKCGADLWDDGLTLNGDENGRLYTKKIEFNDTGIPFYNLTQASPAELEARSWIDCILNDTPPVVRPEQAWVVSEILEAVYTSSETGKAVYFDESFQDWGRAHEQKG
jgi:predicted dehydrogenase